MELGSETFKKISTIRYQSMQFNISIHLYLHSKPRLDVERPLSGKGGESGYGARGNGERTYPGDTITVGKMTIIIFMDKFTIVHSAPITLFKV